MSLWWHVYGGEVAGITVETEEDPEGYGWALVVMGESTMDPESVQEKLPEVTHLFGPDTVGIPYLASFDHDPTEGERQALTPEEYRDEDEVRVD